MPLRVADVEIGLLLVTPRVDDPVFAHPGPFVFAELGDAVESDAARRDHFDDQIGRASHAFVINLRLSTAGNEQHIRLARWPARPQLDL